MNTSHADLGELGPELRKLLQAILDGIDPAVRAAAQLASSGSPGNCQQVWCPVCALAAAAAGEEHPLLTLVAEHSVTLLEVLRTVVGAAEAAEPTDEPPTGPGGAPPASGYQAIEVTIEKD